MKKDKITPQVIKLLAPIFFAAASSAAAQQPPLSPSDETIRLTAFQVTDSGGVGYGSALNTTGRLAQAYQDTPQMISVVTSELMKDAQLFTNLDAIRFVPGVTLAARVIQGMAIRGLGTQNFYLNGFSTTQNVMFSTAFVDRVEVVKGPSPTSFGRGDPSGFLNYIAKKPLFNTATDVGFVFSPANGNPGTIATERFVLDNNGFVSADRKTAYRLVAFYGRGADTQYYSKYEDSGAMLAVTKRLERGDVTINGLYTIGSYPGSQVLTPFTNAALMAGKVAGARGIGAPAIQFPVLNGDFAIQWKESGYRFGVFSLQGLFNYKLSEHWSTRQAASVIDISSEVKRLALNTGPSVFKASDGTIMVAPSRTFREMPSRTLSYQSDFLGEYSIPAINSKINLLAGGDFSKIDNVFASINSVPAAQPFLNWNPNVILPPFAANINYIGTRTTGNNRSAYAQIQSNYLDGRLVVTAALTKIYRNQSVLNRATGTSTPNITVTPILPTYSVVFKPLKEVSIFGLHSEYIDPPTTLQRFANIPDPKSPLNNELIILQPQTKLDEVGLKGSFLAGKISLSVCRYLMTQGGAGQTTFFTGKNPDGSLFTYTGYTLSDTKVQGYEFEVFGQVSRKLSFMINGAFPDSKARPVLAGNVVESRIGDLARNLNFYGTYNFGNSRASGLNLTMGAKVILSGWETDGSGASRSSYPDSIQVLDIGLSYGFKFRDHSCDVFLKGNNVIHQEAVAFSSQANYPGRQIFMGFNTRF